MTSGRKDKNIGEAKLRHLVRRTARLKTLMDEPKKMMYDFGVKVVVLGRGGALDEEPIQERCYGD